MFHDKHMNASEWLISFDIAGVKDYNVCINNHRGVPGMKNIFFKKTITSAMLIALGLALPFLTGQLPPVGNMLLPMHIPALLCGLICGPLYGLLAGLVLPVLRSVLFSMPVMYPTAVAMSFELGAYGLTLGLLYSRSSRKCTRALYRCMLIAMLCGRAVWGIAEVFLLGIGDGGFTLKAFVGGAFLNALPGIALQLILIPAIMVALGRARLVPFSKNKPDGKNVYASK